ncbi:MAG TPA: NRDE family protein [Planctomycetaceae bacterium]|jgi:uncharacterized protein with NRDE domain|nr:NRDE family protein [Planctomycetaceae bacterium]
MCIFSVAYRVLPECPIFVLTNRDESTGRLTLSPRIFESTTPNGSRWFGGADQRAGGTWLGVNEHGLLAAVTNRKTASVPENPRSRGLLCRDVLEGAADEHLLGELASGAYAGFNLIVLAPYSADVFEHADESLWRELKPGVHTIGNGHLDAGDDPRVQRTQRLVEEMVSAERDGGWTHCIERAREICRLPAEGNLPGICLEGEGWGTVGSTVVGLALDPRESVYHYAAGPPSRTPYVDYSQSLRQLFERSASGL